MTQFLKRAGAFCAGVLAMTSLASAQVVPSYQPVVPGTNPPTAPVALTTTPAVPFAPNWLNGPVGLYKQDVYPYAGQCYSDLANPIAGLPQCTTANAPSFACAAAGVSNQSAFSAACGSVTGPTLLLPLDGAQSYADSKFKYVLLNPLDYTPDTTVYLNADYYEIAVHEAQGFQAIATAGTALGLDLFPNPMVATPVAGAAVPEGKQWTGLVDPVSKAPLYTPIWGVGQVNKGGGPVTTTLQGAGLFPTTGFVASPWSANNYVATWPSISIRAETGRPVVVKWINEFPNNHLFCPHPEAADWSCSIDRTFMGVKATVNPGESLMPWDRVNQYGSPMQPDNSWVTHLHGGEIPPQTDGFAEKWFGNAVTAPLYNGTNPATPKEILPFFNAPFNQLLGTRTVDPTSLTRTIYNNDTYAYPIVQGEATIWFHDHTLGKTHHNVVAGPAGFFPVKDPSKHGSQVAGACAGAPVSCEYTWLDPVTEPRGALGIPKYDLFLAIQDRGFNSDGSINFPNGIGNAPGAPLAVLPVGGLSPATPGANPQIHPVWVPEYFGDHALVNGVLWPRHTVPAGWHRIRMVDGSDARCYTIGFGTAEPLGGSSLPAPTGTAAPAPIRNVKFQVIANEQGYLPTAVLNQTSFTMCPGERYEILIDFSQTATAYTDPVTKAVVPACKLGAPGCPSVFMNNSAGAPFPAGLSPQAALSPWPALGSIMRFDVAPAGAVGVPAPVPSCPTKGANVAGVGGINGTDWPATATGCIKIPTLLDIDFVDVKGLPDCPRIAGSFAPDLGFNGGNCVAVERQLYLNERLAGPAPGTPTGMQVNGMPFEYNVTETPRKGTWERWKVINTTVDTHPMHPHLIKAQIVSRQSFNRNGWMSALCAATGCNGGPAVGGVPMLTPDVTPFLVGAAAAPARVEFGWKDVIQTPPSKVTTIIAKWDGTWVASASPTAPGAGNGGSVGTDAKAWTYPDVTSGPYVWHCHINSHEDSEMMRTSLVVP